MLLVATGTLSSETPMQTLDPTFVEFDLLDLFGRDDICEKVAVDPSDHMYAAATVTEEHQYATMSCGKAKQNAKCKKKCI